MTTLSMPSGAEFVQCSFNLQYNTQSFTSPLSRATQTLELPGARWAANYQVTIERGDVRDDDDMHGKWKAFLTQLRGMSKRFYAYDPAHRVPRGQAGQGVPSSESAGNILLPSTSLQPSTTLKPSYEGFDAVGTADTGTVFYISGNELIIKGLTAWDYSQGANPLFDAGYYFKPGDYFQIGNELKLITDYSIDDKAFGKAEIKFEPPFRTIPSVGDTVTITNPSCIMRLIDDSQANWSMSAGYMHQFNFAAIESFT